MHKQSQPETGNTVTTESEITLRLLTLGRTGQHPICRYAGTRPNPSLGYASTKGGERGLRSTCARLCFEAQDNILYQATHARGGVEGVEYLVRDTNPALSTRLQCLPSQRTTTQHRRRPRHNVYTTTSSSLILSIWPVVSLRESSFRKLRSEDAVKVEA